MKLSNIYAVCSKHGELGSTEVNRGGLLRSGNIQYRCKVCARKDQKKNYATHKTQLKKYRSKNKS